MRIAYLSSALSPHKRAARDNFDFFTILMSGVVRNSHSAGLAVNVFVPEKSSETESDQRAILDSLLQKIDDFDAYIIAPFTTEAIKLSFHQNEEAIIKQRSGRLHKDTVKKGVVICVDKKIDAKSFPNSLHNHFTFLNVTCDNVLGGYIAGDIINESFLRAGPGTRLTIIVMGLEGSGERGEACRRRLLDTHGHSEKQIKIVEDRKDLNFTRDGARSWMSTQLKMFDKGDRSCLFGKPGQHKHIRIFSCNDEMALGLRDAVEHRFQTARLSILKYSSSRWFSSQDVDAMQNDLTIIKLLHAIKIVGFDYIGAAERLINPDHTSLAGSDRWLIGTVDVRVGEQAKQAIDLILRVVKGHTENDILLEPQKIVQADYDDNL